MKFPYKKARKGQLELIEIIRNNLGRKIFLKAPTGFGKTVVALISHATAEKVLYAVRTRNEMSPVIKELRKLGENFTIVFSAARMCPLNPGGEIHEFWLNCKLLRSRNMCPYYLRLNLVSDEEILKLLKESRTDDPHVLVKELVNSLGVCPFFALTRLVSKVKFTIATYPYIFREDVYETAFEDLSRSEIYLILDEAHTVLNPQLVIDEELNEFDVNKAIREVKNNKLGSEVAGYLKHLSNVIAGIKSSLLKRIPKDLVIPDSTIIMYLEDSLISLRAMKLKNIHSISELMSSTTSLSKVVKFIKLLSLPAFKAYGYVSKDGIKTIKALTPQLDYVINIINDFKGALLMSGTLPSEDIIKNVLFSNPLYLNAEEVFGTIFPRHNVFYSVYSGVTSSYRERNEEMYLKYSELIESLIKFVREGVTLIVYPSYKFMKEVIKNVVTEDIPQVAEGYLTSLKDLVEGLKEGKLVIHAVAGGKLTEGLELRDPSGNSLIKLVISAGVPYPQPDDFMSDFRQNLARKVCLDTAKEFTMHVQAGVKVAQALGRAVRSERDRAFMVLADRRFLSAKIRKALGLNYDLVTSDISNLLKHLRMFFEGYI